MIQDLGLHVDVCHGVLRKDEKYVDFRVLLFGLLHVQCIQTGLVELTVLMFCVINHKITNLCEQNILGLVYCLSESRENSEKLCTTDSMDTVGQNTHFPKKKIIYL